ncbi:gliding motility lipoprotein GldD [Zunongwangia profunda]|uniref:Gliding motility protein GldD n=2 Tax=Zunongwangia profunda TaxID=398743 RepID=D5BCG3_ZUNPS|nr:gliding motility lipoprotein GldD [Zunongwangia profunda]ADF54789.1 gliding motility protein GldD [Zunongwangia profunda SM-A87]MAS71634.1 gliding motility lipoprotein GldD [Zunongwangia sp.]HCV83073.1 gliding motility lipoprotein GldD [Zunongwangia profunda]|tara:strand:- start:1359 stop:1925 length:567 start_codon:yes stop_codon:yes gene_type:complete
MRYLGYTAIFFIFCLMLSCGNEVKPKPKAMLALSYPQPAYQPIRLNCPYTFEKNQLAEIAPSKSRNACWLNLDYPLLKGTIFITYQPVRNNLDSLLRDAQKLPLEHTIKADAIEGDIYTNDLHKVYGMFYELEGDAASQAQFYITDSTTHFLTGAVYFNTQPNYDSIYPAADYIKQDMRHLMETLRWQ